MTKALPDKPFVQVVREAAVRLGDFDAATLGDEIGVQTRVELKRVRISLKELARMGEVVSNGGRYRYLGKHEKQAESPIADCMWRVVRGLNKCGDAITVASVVQLSGSDRHYCGEYLRRLALAGIVRVKRTIGPKHLAYALVKDPGPKPPAIPSKRKLSKMKREPAPGLLQGQNVPREVEAPGPDPATPIDGAVGLLLEAAKALGSRGDGLPAQERIDAVVLMLRRVADQLEAIVPDPERMDEG